MTIPLLSFQAIEANRWVLTYWHIVLTTDALFLLFVSQRRRLSEQDDLGFTRLAAVRNVIGHYTKLAPAQGRAECTHSQEMRLSDIKEIRLMEGSTQIAIYGPSRWWSLQPRSPRLLHLKPHDGQNATVVMEKLRQELRGRVNLALE